MTNISATEALCKADRRRAPQGWQTISTIEKPLATCPSLGPSRQEGGLPSVAKDTGFRLRGDSGDDPDHQKAGHGTRERYPCVPCDANVIHAIFVK